jgi:hypothetical protein
MYPAKFSLSINSAPDCTNDFVVYPINTAGSGTQANLVGVNNLYNGTCGTTGVPTVRFAYNVGGGIIQTSPVISLDGTKVAFVESITNGSKFHVLTLGTTGSNGTAFSSPATPGSGNNAADRSITMSGSVSVTRSSPFVDFLNDVAYVGDDIGKVHKFTGVFKGTPTEVVSGWPVQLQANGQNVTTPLSPVVYDGGASHNIFAGGTLGTNSFILCVNADTHSLCSTSSQQVGQGSNLDVIDGPIVDSTAQTVFVTANASNTAQVTQFTTALQNAHIAQIGFFSPPNNRYDGAFDHAYFQSISTGHMYFCGINSSGFPTLYRAPFNASGQLQSTEGTTFQLASSSSVSCTPLTEVFNPNIGGGTDFLFVGVQNNGFNTGSLNCGGTACVVSFNITSSFPTAAAAILKATAFGSGSISGMIVDNVSGATGASQIYFGNLQNKTGVQASQSGLN